MIFYYFLWFFIVCFSTVKNFSFEQKFIYILFLIFLVLVVGLRYQVGGDWGNYLEIYDYFKSLNINDALKVTEPGYAIFNYVSQQLNINDTILVNLCCALIFYYCFYKLSINFVNYWIPLLVSFSYTILVVSMGYTRQSVAIALILLAFSYALFNKKNNFLFLTCIAILFHKTAIFGFTFIPIIYFEKLFKKPFFFYSYAILSFAALTILLYFSTLSGDNIYTSQASEISSSGALSRIIIHTFSLYFYFLYRNLFINKFPYKYRLFDYMVLMIIYALCLAIPFSTLADRFNLYLITFDIFVFSLLYPLLSLNNRNIMLAVITLINTLVLVVWLNFGTWSHAWLPYQNYISNYIMESI